jgi:hypothetical protein
MTTTRPNALMIQTLHLLLARTDPPIVEIRVTRDPAPIGSAASIRVIIPGEKRDIAYPIAGFVSQAQESATATFELAYETAGQVWSALREKGYRLIETKPVESPRMTIDRFERDPAYNPLRGLDQVALMKQLDPYLGAIRSQKTCAVIHEYSFETQGGLAISDEVALQWGRQSRALRSSIAHHNEAMITHFQSGDQLYRGVLHLLTQQGWRIEARDFQWQAPATLSNYEATQITHTVTLKRRPRLFGIIPR